MAWQVLSSGIFIPHKGVVNTECLRGSKSVLCVRGGHGSAGGWLRNGGVSVNMCCVRQCDNLPQKDICSELHC